CASGHSEAMNCVKPASAARAGVKPDVVPNTERVSRKQFRVPTNLIYCMRAYRLQLRRPNYVRREICTARSGESMSKLKSIPAFKTEAEERKFWETHDSTDYIDWSKAERVRFPNLKPSTTAISIRLPLGLLEQIKIAANKRDVPYQSLIKVWLAEKVK